MEKEPKEMKPDILFTLILILAKLTVLPQMPWLYVAIPFLISVYVGFIHGVRDGMKERNKDK
jgi:hypothetical protein